jgi:hypothetical protein
MKRDLPYATLQAQGWQPTIQDNVSLCKCHAAAGDAIGIWINIEVSAAACVQLAVSGAGNAKSCACATSC